MIVFNMGGKYQLTIQTKTVNSELIPEDNHEIKIVTTDRMEEYRDVFSQVIQLSKDLDDFEVAEIHIKPSGDTKYISRHLLPLLAINRICELLEEYGRIIHIDTPTFYPDKIKDSCIREITIGYKDGFIIYHDVLLKYKNYKKYGEFYSYFEKVPLATTTINNHPIYSLLNRVAGKILPSYEIFATPAAHYFIDPLVGEEEKEPMNEAKRKAYFILNLTKLQLGQIISYNLISGENEEKIDVDDLMIAPNYWIL